MEEVVRCPDPDGFIVLHAVENAPPQVGARPSMRQRVFSDMCAYFGQILDLSLPKNVYIFRTNTT